MCTSRLLTVCGGVPAWEGVPAQGVYLPRGTCPGTPPPVNRMTNKCKNITLPQTSFASGNYNKFEQNVFRKCSIKCLTIFNHNLKQYGQE